MKSLMTTWKVYSTIWERAMWMKLLSTSLRKMATIENWDLKVTSKETPLVTLLMMNSTNVNWNVPWNIQVLFLKFVHEFFSSVLFCKPFEYIFLEKNHIQKYSNSSSRFLEKNKDMAFCKIKFLRKLNESTNCKIKFRKKETVLDNCEIRHQQRFVPLRYIK